MSENSEIVTNSGTVSGTVRTKNSQDGIHSFQGYIFWYKAEMVNDYIYNFLVQKFPDPRDLIVQEVNRIDMVVMAKNDKIPVEIQSTPLIRQYQKYTSPSLAHFENFIRRQLEENITTYGTCWFFFDAELYRYTIDGIKKSSALNLTWLRKYIKDNLLKIFTIKYNGEIRELFYKDFDFLSQISTCCPIGADQDSNILNKNKLEILYRLLTGYGFLRKEYTECYNRYKSYCLEFGNGQDYDHRFSIWLQRKGCTDREKLLGYIISVLADLNVINSALDCKHNDKRNEHVKMQFKIMGLLDIDDRVADKFNMAEVLPGYMRKKELWEDLKGQRLDNKRLMSIISGKVSQQTLFWYKEDKTDGIKQI